MSGGAILVTGGSRGIGRAIVERLVEAGERVAFTYRSDATGAQAIEQAQPGRSRGYALDLSDVDAPDELIRLVEADLGPLAGLVNNAAVRVQGLVALTSSPDWSSVIEVNLGGPFRCCRAVLPGMIQRREGAIVNVASVSALRGVAGQGAYAASKAGLLGLTRSLAREVGKRGIRVNAVAPGYVPTEMTAGLSGAEVAALRATECLRDGVDPGSVAAAVRFLLSAEARSITGQCLVVDAGASV
jgi:3-oxoacyl-[acyl-carrier protein] reductase